MNSISFPFSFNDRQLEEIQYRYALLEPLVDDYLSREEKQEYAAAIRQELRISERTLRRYLQRFREQGAGALVRKKRSDAGQLRVFSEQILKRAQELLKQNPRRSLPLLMELLSADAQVGEQVKTISPSTLYFHLKKSGHEFGGRNVLPPTGMYRRFEAEYPNQLWQGDARHGIPLPHPDKPGKYKMTYLFAWVDDFSRKIMEARYYWDEKLPRMEDCFRRAVLRWGLPEKLYCDNGRVYLSKHFLILLIELQVKKIHHRAYAAWCKGKVENIMKTIKRFQSEATLAGFRTLEELNSALSAWVEVQYNGKLHSGTGETPNERWQNNLKNHPPRRIQDLDAFNATFLWRTEKVIDKYGNIRFQNNTYPIHGLAVGTSIQLRYNPFDLAQVKVYYQQRFYCTLRASKLSRKAVLEVPEERKQSRFSPEAAEYFKRIREKASELQRQEAEELRYSELTENGGKEKPE
jgi:transposase InsO family protein